MKMLTAAWLSVFCIADIAKACSCAATTVALRIEESADVFVGTVLSLKPEQGTATIRGDKLTLNEVNVRIRVEQSWKGPHRDVVEVVTSSSDVRAGWTACTGPRPGQCGRRLASG